MAAGMDVIWLEMLKALVKLGVVWLTFFEIWGSAFGLVQFPIFK